ncbi:MAG: hypothetical protein FWH12_02050 [Treponema sp.]|nr:hypothetical protein [Treponema sp.]
MKWILILLGIFCVGFLGAQEEPLLWDLDTIFDVPWEELSPELQTENPEDTMDLASYLRRRSVIFDASFGFLASLSPGLSEAPWYAEEYAPDGNFFTLFPNVRMRTDLSLDAQLSDTFRVRNALFFQIPNFGIRLQEFFFDYTLYDRAFLRGGLFTYSWGISPNYGFTNLLSRVPEGVSGDSFIVRADLPMGIGGLQLLALTRHDLTVGQPINWTDFGYGIKYNLATQRADIDTGAYYMDTMAARGFFSVKTTIKDTEVYYEWLVAADLEHLDQVTGGTNFGFYHDYFQNRLSVNGEFFFNAETNSFWYRPETSLQEAETTPLIDGFNIALNLLYRLDGRLSPRVFVQTLYAPQQKSARVVPGIRLSPWPHAEFYFAMPMALGERDGYYYHHTPDPRNRPLSFIMLFTMDGNFRIGHYF